MEEIIIQVLYCIAVVAMITIGILSGLLIFFCIFGWTCMSKRDMNNVWKSLWKGRVK